MKSQNNKPAIAMAIALLAGVLLLTGCATTAGALGGAGIGALAGDASKGAMIGGSVGAVVDIVD